MMRASNGGETVEDLPERAKAGARGIHRILVAVDASDDSRAALEAAIRLAAVVGAEVLALYVEDEDLLRLSGLPFTREMDPLSGEPRLVGPDDMQRQIQAESVRIRETVERLARRFRVRWTFRTSRGRVTRQLLEAAMDADVVTIGIKGRSPGIRTGSTCLGIVRTGDRPVLVVRKGARLGDAICVLHDGSEAGREALSLAVALTRTTKRALTVFLFPETGPPLPLADETREWLRDQGTQARLVHLSGGEVPELARVLREEGCGLLLMARDLARGEASRDLSGLLYRVTFPVLIVG